MLYWLDSIIHAEHTEIDTVRRMVTKIKIPYDPMILEIRIRISELKEALLAAKIAHYVNEDDPFYSCHATESYYECHGDIRKDPRICTCGADTHNKNIEDHLQ